MSNSEPLNDDTAEWLLTSRAKIQRSLVNLWTILNNDKLVRMITNDKRTLYLFGQLMGAAFSLWRAAFLTDTDRNLPIVISHAKSFLEAVIKDNSITYPQDRAARAWSVGYYLNNARYRLRATLNEQPDFPPSEVSRDFMEIFDKSFVDVESRITWDRCHALLAELISFLQSR